MDICMNCKYENVFQPVFKVLRLIYWWYYTKIRY